MFGFDKIFDFNRDGKLDGFERAMQFQFLNEMSHNADRESGDFGDDERREVMEDAGLDPDEFDF